MDDGKTFVMVDLETLGTRAGCKVISVGCVTFGPGGLGAEFYRECLRGPQGTLCEDQDTVDWWGRQAAIERDRLFNQDDNKCTLGVALNDLNDWLRRVAGPSGVTVWGNGASFDNAILDSAYDAVGPTKEWGYYDDRCYRTLKAMAPAVKLARVGTHHNALDDAKSQAEHATRILKTLGLWKT